MSSNFDYNISNYSISELLKKVGVNTVDKFNKNYINKQTIFLSEQYPEHSDFFYSIKQKLFNYIDQNLKKIKDDEDSTDDDEDNTEDDDDEDYEDNKNFIEDTNRLITDWLDKKDVTQLQQNEKKNLTYEVPVKQGLLNPTLQNTTKHFVNLDSQFRQYNSGLETSSTNYTLDLSDPIKNTVKLKLYSYQIPYSWYNVDKNYNNNCMWIYDVSNSIIVNISISSGNYTSDTFVTTLNNAFVEAGFTFPERTTPDYPYNLDVNTPAYYNSLTGKLSFFLYEGIYNNGNYNFTVTTDTVVIFFDFTGKLLCNLNCKPNNYLNNSMGWLMGFKIPYINVDTYGNTATAMLNLNGTKYLMLVVDDYNKNRINNTIVTVNSYPNSYTRLPSYYTNDLLKVCSIPENVNNVDTLMTDISNNQTENNNNVSYLLNEKFEDNLKTNLTVVPNAPRTLSNNQIYTINEILKNNKNHNSFLATSPTSSDIFAILPIKTSSNPKLGSLLVDFSGSLQMSERTYFGPVDIERMRIKLLDDRGNILNLNGIEWCVTFTAECLYQY